MTTPTTWKIIDTDGNKLIVKYTKGTQVFVNTIAYDPDTHGGLEQFLDHHSPFPPELPDVDHEDLVGREGEVNRR